MTMSVKIKVPAEALIRADEWIDMKREKIDPYATQNELFEEYFKCKIIQWNMFQTDKVLEFESEEMSTYFVLKFV